MKICTKCNENKELKEFRKRSDSKDGLGHWCKICSDLSQALWQKDGTKKGLKKKAKEENEKLSSDNKKRCTKCKEIKELVDFPYRKDSKDGLRSHCKSCVSDRNVKVHAENREERNAESKTYYVKNKEKRLKQQKILNAKHKVDKPNYHKDYYDKNRESILLKKSTYIQENLSKIGAKNVKRCATQKHRTPSWITKEQVKEIEDTYIEAARLTKETGIKHHVDHILPLQGEEISGLHVPWNLQILTAPENIRKSNKFDFTYDNLSWSTQ